jgi:adrenodoxin-NADP+ reductase
LAIIGSGPAGFYTASKVLKHNSSAKIDMYERLPVPYGLVRYGVAPDHPEVKNCQDRFDEIAESPGFDFIGNVDVGGQIPLDVMRRHYDAFLFTYGASEDRTLGIPGEDLKGVWSARSFVAWYNGLPGYDQLKFSLDQAERAVVIGQGNVSLDVARILLTPVDDLRKTDIPEHVLQTLSESTVKHASAVGRRGPLQVRLFEHNFLFSANIVQGCIYDQGNS